MKQYFFIFVLMIPFLGFSQWKRNFPFFGSVSSPENFSWIR